jgi:hypothetical protein
MYLSPFHFSLALPGLDIEDTHTKHPLFAVIDVRISFTPLRMCGMKEPIHIIFIDLLEELVFHRPFYHGYVLVVNVGSKRGVIVEITPHLEITLVKKGSPGEFGIRSWKRLQCM